MTELTGAQWDVLWCLFLHGPRQDGEIPSKVGRNDLFLSGMVGSGSGWNWLTGKGARLALSQGMGERKERGVSAPQS